MSALYGIVGCDIEYLYSVHPFQCLGGFFSAFDGFYLPLTLHPLRFSPSVVFGLVAILVSCLGGVVKAFLAFVCPFVCLDSILVSLHLSARFWFLFLIIYIILHPLFSPSISLI